MMTDVLCTQESVGSGVESHGRQDTKPLTMEAEGSKIVRGTQACGEDSCKQALLGRGEAQKGLPLHMPFAFEQARMRNQLETSKT